MGLTGGGGACDCHMHIYGPAARYPATGTQWLPDAATRQAVLVDNPARLYGFTG